MGKFLKTALMLFMVGQAPVQAATQLTLDTSLDKLPGLERSNKAEKGLPGLMAIDSQEYASAIQPTSDFENLYLRAQLAQNELAMLTHRVAYLSSTQADVPAVKGRERALAKLEGKLDGDVRLLTDLARTTLVAEDVDGLLRAYHELDRQGEVVRVKNRFLTPKANGYRDLNLLVRLPDSQMVAEVQIHLRSFANIKSGPEHDFYQQIQEVERQALAERRSLSEFERARVQRLRQQSAVLYRQAWEAISPPGWVSYG
ncbi:hypothetical protein FCL40_08700 [Ferrimonas sediminicola]|uniref:RelA/SpoT domain-containing protein n=1 Tax=Ferrimonas sediminicola TaxID=2569538 RepID=A0A4U1BHA8_9GAMM|nr:hypothetical protein [Ferrimonas sediminicola]TKB49401.1 hypothetical protein FCL40_08700 [Ferrimonas sediminicola]